MPGAANAKAPRLSMGRTCASTLRDTVLRTAPQGEVLLWPHPEEPRAVRRLEGWRREEVSSCSSRIQATQIGHRQVEGEEDGLRWPVGAMEMHGPVGRAGEPLEALALRGKAGAVGLAHGLDAADRVLALGFEALEFHMAVERQILLRRIEDLHQM